MTDWQEHYDRRDWVAVDDWWRQAVESADIKELKHLLARLRVDLPMLRRENGMERLETPPAPSEVSEEWRGAAEILLLGELEATVEAVPATERWAGDRRRAKGILLGCAASEEATTGHPDLSRKAHAEAALEGLAIVETIFALTRDELDPEDGAWILEDMAEVAYLAFHAGANARAAAGKEFEGHAVRGRKTIESAKSGGEARAKETSDRSDAIVAAMDELIPNVGSKANAARIVFERGLGTSAQANRELWYSKKRKL